jgi:hypothetical protein
VRTHGMVKGYEDSTRVGDLVEPINRMKQRLEVAAHDSETAVFFELLYFGEMMLKLTTLGLLAGIQADRDRHRYRLEHELVRRDGIGDWKTVLDDAVLGPASQHLREEVKRERTELTQRFGSRDESWQYEAARQLGEACRKIDHNYEASPAKLSLMHLLADFVWLRNKTRGHGATVARKCEAASSPLLASLTAVAENFLLFRRSWAYLHRNLSGKYRVIPLAGSGHEFGRLKRKTAANLTDGIYIYYEEPAAVHLMTTDLDLSDFFFANGGFKGGSYELLSYITDQREVGNGGSFVDPPTPLPASETEGIGSLEVQGNTFGNIPPTIGDYVERPQLEEELSRVLLDDRHPVVTLAGRGGIGKTSLALHVLHTNVMLADRFTAAIWFSARDIDLRPEGPKIVRPRVLSLEDMAEELAELLQPAELIEKGFDVVEYFSGLLQSQAIGSLLFVFDNFETVRNPADLFSWLDTYVRPPNKALITTRHREFKGDWPVGVGGMTEDEFGKLVSSLARRLGIQKLISQSYISSLFDETDGHPYVAKVLLGEVARTRQPGKVERLMAGQEEMLEALFERTYNSLSPAGQRVFLTLCNWRSAVPQFGLEASLLRPANEKMDVSKAIEELYRSSLIEISRSSDDSEDFLIVPLSASIFGRKKLTVSPHKVAIDADTEVLRFFGAGKQSDIERGVSPRIKNLFRNVAGAVQEPGKSVDDYLPVIDYVAQRVPEGWLLLADLHYEQQHNEDGLAKAEGAIRRYLESRPHDAEAWKKLAQNLYRRGDSIGELKVMVQASLQPKSDYFGASAAANNLNYMMFRETLTLPQEEIRVLANNLLSVLMTRIEEANATDCSRIAWLLIRFRSDNEAKPYVELGLSKDSANVHCLKLASKLGMPTPHDVVA